MRRLSLRILILLLAMIFYANLAICQEDNNCLTVSLKQPVCKGNLILTESSCCSSVCEKTVSWDYYNFGFVSNNLIIRRVLHGMPKENNPVIIKLRFEKGKELKLRLLYSDKEVTLVCINKEGCLIVKDDSSK